MHLHINTWGRCPVSSRFTLTTQHNFHQRVWCHFLTHQLFQLMCPQTQSHVFLSVSLVQDYVKAKREQRTLETLFLVRPLLVAKSTFRAGNCWYDVSCTHPQSIQPISIMSQASPTVQMVQVKQNACLSLSTIFVTQPPVCNDDRENMTRTPAATKCFIHCQGMRDATTFVTMLALQCCLETWTHM